MEHILLNASIPADIQQLLSDIAGWIGSICVVGAYALLSMQKIKASSWAYQILNFVGSIGLLIHTVFEGAQASAFVNLIWLFIALGAMYNIYKGRNLPQS